MMAQLLSAITLLFSPDMDNYKLYFRINIALVTLVFAATTFVSVPIHNKMAQFFDSNLIHSLVITNWIRTIAWTVNSLLLLYLLTRVQFE